MCRRIRIILLIMFVVNLGVQAKDAVDSNEGGRSKGSGEKLKVKENLPGQVPLLFQWPDLDKIPQEKIKDPSEENLIGPRVASITWTKRIISDRWLPKDHNDLESRIIMIKDEYGPIDATHIEWERDGYRFRVTQSKTVFTMIVSPVENGKIVKGEKLEDKVASARDLCTQIVREYKKVERTTGKEVVNIVPKGTRSIIREKIFGKGNVKKCSDGLVGICPKPKHDDRSDWGHYSYWWRRIGWWTDGQNLGLYTLKIRAGAWIAVYAGQTDYTWFDGPKRHPRHMSRNPKYMLRNVEESK